MMGIAALHPSYALMVATGFRDRAGHRELVSRLESIWGWSSSTAATLVRELGGAAAATV